VCVPTVWYFIEACKPRPTRAAEVLAVEHSQSYPGIPRVGQNLIYICGEHTVLSAGKSPNYSHIRCIYTVLANPRYKLSWQNSGCTLPCRVQGII